MAEAAKTSVPYAVVATGGKQYLVREKNTFRIELRKAGGDGKVELKPVLAISDGQTLTVGKPEVSGAKVVCTVLEDVRGPKLFSFKKKRRKGYRRKIGHRQDMTVVRVDSIVR